MGPRPSALAVAGMLAASAWASAGTVELIGKTMDDIEKWAIVETLKITSGNREEAARILAIGARTLYRKSLRAIGTRLRRSCGFP